MRLSRYLTITLAAGLIAGCASRTPQVPAVVESDAARRVAAEAARTGDSPDEALEKSEAADPSAN